MGVATACRVDERKFVGFSFKCDSRPEFAGHSIGYCFTDLMARLGFVSVNGSLTLCYLYRNSGGARGVMVNVVGIGYDDTSSNPGRD